MRRASLPLLLLCTTAALLCACGNKNPSGQTEGPKKPPGIEANPERLAFLCVTPGCDTTESVYIQVNGDRRVAIKRILLAGDAAPEFSITPSEEPPFIVGSNAGFDVAVHYVPQGAPVPGAMELRITYTDASPDESPDRLEPGELVVPLVRRLVGEPVMTATPQMLSFGVVAAGSTQQLPLTIANEGFGNIALELSSIESKAADVAVALPEQKALEPGKSVDVPVGYAPAGEGYLSSEIIITSTAPEVPPLTVKVEGTSLTVPQVGFEPDGNIDFGELPKGKTRSLTTHLVNRGGQDLQVTAITATDATGNVKVTLPNNGALTVAPLERVELPMLVDAQTAGPVDAVISVLSNDPATPQLDLHVTGLVTEPRLTVTPATLDYGTVPVGWVITKPVELKNTGWGKLTIKNVTMVSGSSNLFTLGSIPSMPLTLNRDQRAVVEVEFRAETTASFKGWLSVETDDPVANFTEVPIVATVGSCLDACPIAHGTPACTNGKCEVGTCNTGWYDTDLKASTGCECAEVGTDPGAFCTSSVYKGTLNDNDGDQTSHTGVIPTPDDEDLIRFWAEDGFALFSENFKVKIRLDTGDPGLRMCVYRHDGSHSNECYFTNEVCYSPGQTYQRNGSGGSGDDADFTIKVFRTASSTPTCNAYTLFMSNGI